MKILWLFGLALVSQAVNATEMVNFARPIRSLGMGGAYVSFVKDADAVFFNPAALAKIPGFNMQIFNIELGTNQDTFESAKDFSSITGSSSPSDYSKFFGKKVGAHAGGSGAVAIHNFGVGIYDTYLLSGQLNNPAYPQFDLNFINDIGVAVGASISVGPYATFGLAVKRVNRWGGPATIGVGSISSGGAQSIEENFKNKGLGYGADAALMMSGDSGFHPTVAVVWQDMGMTTFQKTDGLMAPPRIQDNLTVGLGTFVDLPGLDWTTSAELQHLTDSSEQFGKKVHLGTEFSLPLIDLRAGLNQGYTTYGAGFDFFFFKVDAAYYKEELGAYPGQTPDTRFEIGISLDISFDANFSFIDTNTGKRRKLKQRR